MVFAHFAEHYQSVCAAGACRLLTKNVNPYPFFTYSPILDKVSIYRVKTAYRVLDKYSNNR